MEGLRLSLASAGRDQRTAKQNTVDYDSSL